MNRQSLLISAGIAGAMVVLIATVYPRPATTRAEYCAEEMITRTISNGRLVEHRHCASWVGWPIEVSEVRQ